MIFEREELTHTFEMHWGRGFEESVAQRLPELNELWNEGRQPEVRKAISGIKSNQLGWGIFDDGVKADYLRLEAVTYLNTDIEEAQRLANEAKMHSANIESDTRLSTMLAYRRGNIETALDIVEPLTELASVNLKAALMLESGDPQGCLGLLSFTDFDLRPDAETHRVRALAHIALKDLGKARDEAQLALDLKPRWWAVRSTAAAVEYYSGLSPLAVELNCRAAPP